VGTENFLNLDDYFQLEGLAYHLVPIKADKKDDSFRGTVAADLMYDNVMNKFRWGNMKDKRVYLDENNLRMTTNLRINTIRLADALLDLGKKDSALKLLDKTMEEMPDYNVPYNIFMTRVAEQYFRIAGNLSDSLSMASADVELNVRKSSVEKGIAIVKRLSEIYSDNMDYYLSLKKDREYYKLVEPDVNQALYTLQSLPGMVRNIGQKELSDSLQAKFQDYYQRSGL
ncbi:MAG TPA: hypothetical protein VI757_04630, partial [Bacteroidia bacterium]|nr:hypothetical protein [Bacteroidia bacterium]